MKKWLTGSHLGFKKISLLEKSYEAFMVIEERGEKTEERGTTETETERVVT